jgi:hypothetical protein
MQVGLNNFVDGCGVPSMLSLTNHAPLGAPLVIYLIFIFKVDICQKKLTFSPRSHIYPYHIIILPYYYLAVSHSGNLPPMTSGVGVPGQEGKCGAKKNLFLTTQ